MLRAFGEEVAILLEGEGTDGKLTMWIEITPPGGGPAPHYHANEDEVFHVLEGRVAFLVKGEWREVGPGAAAYMPRSVIHTFKNVGERPSRMLVATMPSGFEKFLLSVPRNLEKAAGRICRGSSRWALITGFISCRSNRCPLASQASAFGWK